MATESPKFDWGRLNTVIQQRGYIGNDPQHILQGIDRQHIAKADVVVPFIEQALPQVAEMILTSRPYSFQESLGFAMLWGLQTLSKGNYGIGAVYQLKDGGEEWFIAGRNGLVTDGDTSKHAEMDAIDAAESIARGEDTYKDRVFLHRKALDGKSAKILVTSLDPCPMCRVRAHNHNIPRIMIGQADSLGGSMVGENRDMMPPLWKIILEAQGMELQIIDEDPSSLDYVDPKYRSLITQMFELNREEIDNSLKRGELSAVTTIGAIAQGLRRLLPPVDDNVQDPLDGFRLAGHDEYGSRPI